MAGLNLPESISDIVATAAQLFRHQSKANTADILDAADVSIEQVDYNSWNGGITSWVVILGVPVSLFALVQPRLKSLEKEIASNLQYFSRAYPNDHVQEVTIAPISAAAAASNKRLAPLDSEVQHLWSPGLFRLFLSHISEDREFCGKLKRELRLRGVDAFVAHDAIVPTAEWQREIELALRSMNALAAYITPNFHQSRWTDQEIGWALGRGLLIVPIRAGADPEGFIQKVQGVPRSLSEASRAALSIVDVLISNQRTQGDMKRALVSAFVGANSFMMAKALRPLIVGLQDLSEADKTQIRQACIENSEVKNAFGVSEAIFKTFGKPLEKKILSANDDDIPF